jgi:hypothetical protein
LTRLEGIFAVWGAKLLQKKIALLLRNEVDEGWSLRECDLNHN